MVVYFAFVWQVEVASIILKPQELSMLAWGFSVLAHEWTPGQVYLSIYILLFSFNLNFCSIPKTAPRLADGRPGARSLFHWIGIDVVAKNVSKT